MDPDPNMPIATLAPRPSKQVFEVLSRMVVFLHGVMEQDTKARAILAGYDQRQHEHGVWLTEHIAGQRPFSEWRMWYALRPTHDPDLPDLIDELEAFVDKWLPIATGAIDSCSDPDDRQELRDVLEYPADKPSRVWRAKAWVQLVESLEKVPQNFYQDAWVELKRAGIEQELPRFHEVLKTVQQFIRNAPLEAPELEDLAEYRASMAEDALRWLRERKEQLAPHLEEETCVILGLGELAPPLPPPIPIRQMLAWRGVEN